MTRIAILDDYQNVALKTGDWSALRERCSIEVFNRNLAVPDEAAKVLAPFDIICLIRERMEVTRALIERLPNLKFIAATGPRNRTLDVAAANEHGIIASHTLGRGDAAHATPEHTWALILAAMRHIPTEEQNMRNGNWQTTLGRGLQGRTLGILGLGKIGQRMARIADAFGMKVIAWSQNLTPEKAAACGATWVDKDTLFASSDILTIHLVLSERTRGIVGARELSLMKPRSWLVNTSRGPLVDEAALMDCLRAERIAGAALDVYDQEPLPSGHPLRAIPNTVLTPHLGYVTEETYHGFCEDTVENILAFLDGKPIRVMSPHS